MCKGIQKPKTDNVGQPIEEKKNQDQYSVPLSNFQISWTFEPFNFFWL